MDGQIRIATPQLVSHLLHALTASRNENQRSGPSNELPGKFPADSGGRSGNQRCAAIKLHFASLISSPSSGEISYRFRKTLKQRNESPLPNQVKDVSTSVDMAKIRFIPRTAASS
jgi:hypothetical protein